MFPLPVTIVGCAGDLLKLLRLELSIHSARVESEHLGVESAIVDLRANDAPLAAKNGKGKGDAALEPPRRLFVVHLDSVQELPAIKRLSSFFPGNPILVLMEPDADPNVPITAMRMGASQVVTLPLQADDFKLALDCISNQFGAPAANQVIAVAGVTGGCGATTLAINLAFEVAQSHSNLRVVLAELSLPMGKLPLYLNVEPRYTTVDLLKDIHRIDLYFMQQALTPIVDRFRILAGPYESVSPLSVPSADVLLLIECLRQLADIVVLDVPCTMDAIYFDTLKAADKIVLVGEQKVPSIRALQLVESSLKDKHIHMLLNRYDPNLVAFGVDRLRSMLHVDELWTVASDYASVSSAVNQGLPLRLKEPRSRVLADIHTIAMKLAPRQSTIPNGAKGPGVLSGLIRALGIKK
jgi:pilus assembly protein CpaE